MLSVVLTLSTASVYYAQSVKDTVKREAGIEEVVIAGVADIAKDRKTPVAVSTIKEAQIIEKLGNQEFPEILNSTPSVYATKGGGGFGDARLNIRGFAQENIAVMINGVPVNDMENGSVYWSNWAGLSDVTSAMQVQRGLGSSKLAIASVGGTVNIITRSADKKEGGKVSVGVGNDGYYKTLFSYNTGKNTKGWSTSVLLGRTAGSTFASGTEFEGYNYYVAVGYQPNAKHDFQFTLTGAPQSHNQRAFEIPLQTLLDRGVDGKPDIKYNAEEGRLNGKEYTFRRNYYHKPVMSFNWDWKISTESKLSTVAYASFGRGAGTGDLGSVGGKRASDFRGADGLINFDAILAANAASTPDKGVLIRRSSVNSHNWYGLISSFNHKLNENLNFSVGVDARYYYGFHYQVASDLLGASAYRDRSNLNVANPTNSNYVSNTTAANPDFNPFGGKIDSIENQIGYSNDGEVLWYGGFGQLEYSNDRISAFVQAAVSNQGFQRIDNFILDGQTTLNGKVVSATNQPSATNPILYTKTGFENLVGYNAKAGLNFNIDEVHNVYGNVGYYSKQPFLNSVYPNNKNFLNPNLTNEKILGMELGYGFRMSWLNVNLNAYRTDWKDRFQRLSQNVTAPDKSVIRAYANIQGIREIHQGVELEANSKINKYLSLTGMVSVANWYYKGNATGTLYNETNEPIDDNGVVAANGIGGVRTLLLDDVKVGDAAQTTAAFGFIVEPVKDFRIDANVRYVDRLYGRLNVLDFAGPVPAVSEALRLPSYGLIDAGISYKLKLNNEKQFFTIRGNVFNLFDKYYIQQSYTNIPTSAKTSTAANAPTYEEAGKTYDGIANANQVFFGFGRTWSATLSFNF